MKIHKKLLSVPFLSLLAIICAAGIVYAASFQNVPSGLNYKIHLYDYCRQVTNNASQVLFVPTNTQAEWDSLVENGAPNTNLAYCTCGATISAPEDDITYSGDGKLLSDHNGGAFIKADSASADLACQNLGYQSATTYTTRSWDSCSDNGTAYAVGGTWHFAGACGQGNSGIKALTCSATSAKCDDLCGNGTIDPGEECDTEGSKTEDHCGTLAWVCTNVCTIKSYPQVPRTQPCP